MTPEEQIDAIVTTTFEAIGPEIVADIQKEIAEPYPPASAPGTPPHLRTAKLQGGVSFAIDHVAAIYILSVISETFYSAWLEGGTKYMDKRPFMNPALEKWTPIVAARLQESFGVVTA